jgi:hypothetical protein
MNHYIVNVFLETCNWKSFVNVSKENGCQASPPD